MPQCNGQKKEEDSVNSINAHLSERKSAKAENITGSKQYLTNNTEREKLIGPTAWCHATWVTAKVLSFQGIGRGLGLTEGHACFL